MRFLPLSISTQNVLALAIVAAFLLPYHVHPYSAFYSDWLVIYVVVLGIGYATNGKESVRLNVPLVATIPVFLAVVLVLQILFGVASHETWIGVYYFLASVAAIVIAYRLTSCASDAALVCRSIVFAEVLAALLSAAIASLQYFGQEGSLGSIAMRMAHSGARTIRPYANMGQPNQLALLFCFGLAGLWWLYQQRSISRPTTMLAVVCLFWGLVLTQSKIAWLILPFYACLIVWFNGRTGSRKIHPLLLLLGLLAFALLAAALPHISGLFGILVESPAQRVQHNDLRVVMLQQAWHMMLSHPWFGIGWHHFGMAQLEIGANFGETDYSEHAHNLVANFLAELGIPVTVVVLGALLLWLKKCLFRRDFGPDVAFALLSFAAVSVHSMVEYPLWYAYILIPVSLLIGMVHAHQMPNEVVAVPRSVFQVGMVVGVIVLVLLAFDYRRVVTGFRALGYESMGWKADEGTTERPSYTAFPEYFDYFQFAKTKAAPGMPKEQIEFMEGVAKRFGYAPVLMRMSMVYALNAREDDAVAVLKTMAQLHPAAYNEAYDAWSSLGQESIPAYAKVFNRLPKPNRSWVSQK